MMGLSAAGAMGLAEGEGLYDNGEAKESECHVPEMKFLAWHPSPYLI